MPTISNKQLRAFHTTHDSYIDDVIVKEIRHRPGYEEDFETIAYLNNDVFSRLLGPAERLGIELFFQEWSEYINTYWISMRGLIYLRFGIRLGRNSCRSRSSIHRRV